MSNLWLGLELNWYTVCELECSWYAGSWSDWKGNMLDVLSGNYIITLHLHTYYYANSPSKSRLMYIVIWTNASGYSYTKVSYEQASAGFLFLKMGKMVIDLISVVQKNKNNNEHVCQSLIPK